jgi:hypothetical protein
MSHIAFVVKRKEMAQINARNVPDALYRKVRLAAAGGGSRIRKGELHRFLVRALWQAVESPQTRIKLCAKCVQENQERMVKREMSGPVPMNAYETRRAVVEPELQVDRKNLFAHLIGEVPECVK